MPSVENAEAPKTVAIERGIASCSVNSPSIVNSGTSTAPPPTPAAEASTVAANTAIAHRTSVGPSEKGPSPSVTARGTWKRV